MENQRQGVIEASRNFYGVLCVETWNTGAAFESRALLHGAITHGSQYMESDFRSYPTTYYATMRFMHLLLLQYGSVREALIAWNAGPKYAKGGRTPPRETVQFIERVMERYRFYESSPRP